MRVSAGDNDQYRRTYQIIHPESSWYKKKLLLCPDDFIETKYSVHLMDAELYKQFSIIGSVSGGADLQWMNPEWMNMCSVRVSERERVTIAIGQLVSCEWKCKCVKMACLHCAQDDLQTCAEGLCEPHRARDESWKEICRCVAKVLSVELSNFICLRWSRRPICCQERLTKIHKDLHSSDVYGCLCVFPCVSIYIYTMIYKVQFKKENCLFWPWKNKSHLHNVCSVHFYLSVFESSKYIKGD